MLSTTTRRIGVAAAALLLVAALGIGWFMSTGDGGAAERDRVVERIRSDQRMATAPDPVVDCVADWYMTSATPEQRRAFVDGGTPVTDPAAEADPALLACLKLAT
ncbi:hypothetical protein J2S43_002789 [Catenuloplanes nepalensis]|uniref:Uncharacterized protein n=1 Tax=Catenuloplanes nepalensis TaxID=587533 RepID=A0ABT9MS72_9ACTN|nr:hypothetical protein [Catenuloplanes nepalensis]MDP9794277.1 hypothetical protein [Catenuloplanes nepalensis]